MGKRRHALAGTALADDGQRLARLDVQRNAIHRPHQAAIGAKRDGEVPHI